MTAIRSGDADYSASAASAPVTFTFTAAGFTVTFAGNGATGGSTPSETFTNGTPQALTANGFTRSGYTFLGWNTQQNGSGTEYSDQQTVTLTGAETLYAQWAPTNFVVTFNGNGNTGGSMTNESFSYGVAQALTLNGFTRTGYTFLGWNTQLNGSGTEYSDQQTVTLAGAVTLYAQWSVNTFVVTFSGNNNTGGSTPSETFSYGVPQALTINGFTRAGYTFAGWNTQLNGSGTAYSNQQTVTLTSAVTLYAQWTSNTVTTVTVTFNGNGNTGGSMANETFTSGVPKALSANGFTRTGYTFTGWNTHANGSGTAYGPGATITLTANTTLYAQWTSTKSNSSTTLFLTSSSATYGNEGGVVFTVGVDPVGTPTGTVSILWGSTTLCVITLVNGAGHCSAGSSALPVGLQSITASYSGDSSHNGSTSSPHSLNITKDNSHSTVSESASNAAVGSEGSVLFTAKVSSNNGESIPLGESVTIHVGSASCLATTNGSGSASCSISNGALGAGTYAVSATYGGDSNINGSTSSNALSVTFGSKPVFSTPNAFTLSRGVYLDYKFIVSNGPVTWSYAGNLPHGVTFSAATGALVGTATQGGNYVLTITATNTYGSTSQTFTLHVY